MFGGNNILINMNLFDVTFDKKYVIYFKILFPNLPGPKSKKCFIYPPN